MLLDREWRKEMKLQRVNKVKKMKYSDLFYKKSSRILLGTAYFGDGIGEHDAFDMAYAVMEGVSFLLKKNCVHLMTNSSEIKSIIATGGGAKSDVWCQLQADITGLPIMIPKEKEAACLGAAIIAFVEDGKIESLEKAADMIEFEKVFEPSNDNKLAEKYQQFNKLYEFSCALKGV